MDVTSWTPSISELPSYVSTRVPIPQGFDSRWLPISLCAQMDKIRHFDLLKAFGHIETVVKSDFFSSKITYLTLYVCPTCSELPTSISTMVRFFVSEMVEDTITILWEMVVHRLDKNLHR